jgi:ATP phosphoribosyltransferase regulatory subunit|tara:strand:+ start:206 stop:1255 length:1050 start_codon:yes stop_codon:yes gene_type:complete
MKSKNLSNKILRLIKSKGFKNIELDPVLETKYILQRSGENIRKYLFSFYNSDGRELCLRPDLTISSLLRYAQNNINAKEKVFYTGSAFRKSYNKKNVVVKQIGMEIFSSKNENKDDKEILDTSIKIIKKIGFKKANVKIGNFKLFELLIKKLSMPQRWKSRLLKFYWNEKYFSELLKRLQSNSDIDPIVVAGDKKNYLKMKKENPNKIIAGRSYREIIERYERKINDPRTVETGKYSVKIIREFLKIKCSLKDAPKKLNTFYKKYNLNISVGKDFFPISNLKQKGINFEFSTSNGRGKDVEYYSSFIFSIEVRFKNSIKTLVAGGRYNDLTSKILGLKKIPAVGAAINL